MYSIEGLGLNHSALKHQTIHLRAHPAYVLNCCDGIFGFICLKMKGLFNHLKSSPIKLNKTSKIVDTKCKQGEVEELS